MSLTSRVATPDSTEFKSLLSKLGNLLPYISSYESVPEIGRYIDGAWATWLAGELFYGSLFSGSFVDGTKVSGDIPAQLYNVPEVGLEKVQGYVITTTNGDAWLSSIGVNRTRDELYDMTLSRVIPGEFFKACYTVLQNVDWYVLRSAYVPSSMVNYGGANAPADVLVYSAADRLAQRTAAISAAISNWSLGTEISQFYTAQRRSSSLTVKDTDLGGGVSSYWVSAEQVLVTFKCKPAFGYTFSNKCYYSVYFSTPGPISTIYSPTSAQYDSFSDSGVPVSSGDYVLIEGDLNNELELDPMATTSLSSGDFIYDIDNNQIRNGWSASTSAIRCFVQLGI